MMNIDKIVIDSYSLFSFFEFSIIPIGEVGMQLQNVLAEYLRLMEFRDPDDLECRIYGVFCSMPKSIPTADGGFYPLNLNNKDDLDRFLGVVEGAFEQMKLKLPKDDQERALEIYQGIIDRFFLNEHMECA